MTYVSVASAAAITGASPRVIRELARAGLVRWRPSMMRVMEVVVADIASVVRTSAC